MFTEEHANILMEIKSDVQLLKYNVLGNGTPGLVREVRQLKQDHDQLKGIVDLAKWIVPVMVAIMGIIVKFL